MTTQLIPAPHVLSPSESSERQRGRRKPTRGGGYSLMAQGEPIVWLNGAGLILGIAMILGLLLLVLYQGLTTFWPRPVVSLPTLDNQIIFGEVTRDDAYDLSYGSLVALTGPRREAAGKLLHQRLHAKLSRLAHDQRLTAELARQQSAAVKLALQAVMLAPGMSDQPTAARRSLVEGVGQRLEAGFSDAVAQISSAISQALQAEMGGQAVYGQWTNWRAAEESWLALSDAAAMREALQEDATVEAILGNHLLSVVSADIKAPMRRQLVRVGNYELTNEHFAWVSDYEIAPPGETRPTWALVLERLAWGRFYGFPTALKIDDQAVASRPAEVWAAFQQYHPEVRARWQQRRRLEQEDTGRVNSALEAGRLKLRQIELDYGPDSPQWTEANEQFASRREELDAEFMAIRSQIQQLDQENARYKLVLTTAQGVEKEVELAEIVRAYPANQLSWPGAAGVYLARWGEFLTADPREANSEGGVLPAIWGTVAMTLLMSVAVVPFGILAALFLREYARAGLLVSMVRIAVNNLAGVPSIVFGVFGLGFFCYIIGVSIDELFFEPKLPNPTFGTGGLMWAALTLALLTLPVVIVATEEALAAVPRSMREGSLACGATKWQTIWRIVLPRAMPGVMTGAILAMARGAGEVAPLMLVGAVKLAPKLPLDGEFPFLHLERSFMHLGFHIYDLGFQSQNSDAAKPMVFTTTLLLIAIIACMNLLAIWLRAKLRKKFAYSQF